MSKQPRTSSVHQVQVVASEPRSGNRSRMSMIGGGSGGGISMARTNVVRSSMDTVGKGKLGVLSKQSLDDVKHARNQEKGQMSELNTKLAEHIDRSKYIEAMNQQMQMEIDKWKNMKMFDDTKIRDYIGDEIAALRQDIKDANDKNDELEKEILSLKEKNGCLEDDCKLFKSQKDAIQEEKEKLAKANADLENDLTAMKMEIGFMEDKARMMEKELENCIEDRNRLRCDLDETRLQYMNECTKYDDLKTFSELQYQTKVLENEELCDMIKKMQSLEPNYAKMWEGKFKESIYKIQQDNNQRILQMQDDLKRSYEMKIAKLEQSMPRDAPDSAIDRQTTRTLKSELGNTQRKMSDLERENASLKKQLQDEQEQRERDCRECDEEKRKLMEQIQDEKDEKCEIADDLAEMDQLKCSLEMEIKTYERLLQTGDMMADAAAKRGGYMSHGGELASQAIMGGGGGGSSSSSGGRYGSGGGGSGSGGSSSQTSNQPKKDPVNQQPVPPKKDNTPGSKKKPDGMSEVTKRTSIMKHGSLGLKIEEVPMDGTYVEVLNNSSTERDLSGWKLTRTLESTGKTVSYDFEKGTKIRGSGGRLRIWSSNNADDAKSGDLVAPNKGRDGCRSWLAGAGDFRLTDGKSTDAIATTTIKSV